MDKMIVVRIILFFSLFIIPDLQANNYYVNYKDGLDTNDGLSEFSSWKHCPGDKYATGNPASVILNAGDAVLFKGGIYYRGHIDLDFSGEEGNYVKYIGDQWPQGTKAILDGSQIIEEWFVCNSDSCPELTDHPHINDIYYAYVTIPDAGEEYMELRALSSNIQQKNVGQKDTAVFIAQYPNPGDPYQPDDLNYFIHIPLSQATQNSITDPDNLTDIGDLTGSYIFNQPYSSNIYAKKILAHSPGTDSIVFEENSNSPSNDPYRYSILNSAHPKVFDRPGEYYINETPQNNKLRVFLWPFEGFDPLTSEVSISVYTMCIRRTSGTNYVSIEGFVIQKSSSDPIRSSTNGEFKGFSLRNNEICNIRGGGENRGQGNYICFTDGLLIENNNIHDMARMRGLTLGGTNIVVNNNTLSKIGGTVMVVAGGNNQIVTNNTIYPSKGSHANGISVGGGGDLIAENILIAGNRVYNTARPMTYSATKNMMVYNNIFDNGNSGSYVTMIQGIEHSFGYVAFLNNIFTGAWYGFDEFSDQTDNYIKNNIFDCYVPEGPNMYKSHNLYIRGMRNEDDSLGLEEITGEGNSQIDKQLVFMNNPAYEKEIAYCDDSLHSYIYVHATDDHLDLTGKINTGDYLEYDREKGKVTVTGIEEKIKVPELSNWRYYHKITYEPSLIMKEGKFISVWRAIDEFERDYEVKNSNSYTVNTGVDVNNDSDGNLKQIFQEAKVIYAGFYDLDKDIDGNPRPLSSTWDIGPYEYQDLSAGNHDNLSKDILTRSYPNPFSQSTVISYYLARPADVTLRIYDATGRVVKTLVNEHQDEGDYNITWDGSDQEENQSKTGVYILKIRAGIYNHSEKIVLTK